MGRPRLTERRKTQTRREIAEAALQLFVRDGYDATSVNAIAEHAGISPRTYYHYFSAKDDVLSPIVADAGAELVGLIAARPAEEDLGTAVLEALAQASPPVHPDGPRAVTRLVNSVPALRARWMDDLLRLEDSLVSVVHQRAHHPLADLEAQLSAAVIIAALRVALQTINQGTADLPSAMRAALNHLRNGAGMGGS